jgi:hypothetical protein
LILDGIASEREAQRDELRLVERIIQSGDGDDKIVLPPNHLASAVEPPKLKVGTATESMLKYVILAMSVGMTVMIMLLLRPEPKVRYVLEKRATPTEVITPDNSRAQGARGSKASAETKDIRLRQECFFGNELCLRAREMDLPNVGKICTQAKEVCSHLNK